MVKIVQYIEPADVIAARRAAWLSRTIKPKPPNVEELYDMLKTKGVLADSDRKGRNNN